MKQIIVKKKPKKKIFKFKAIIIVVIGIMAFLDLFGKKQVVASKGDYEVNFELHPFRLVAGKNNSIDLKIQVTNTSGRNLLTAVVLKTQKTLGFDQSAISQEREIRLGEMLPNEVKNLTIPVYATQRTTKGDYKVLIYVISHYRNYSYVLNEIRVEVPIRVT